MNKMDSRNTDNPTNKIVAVSPIVKRVEALEFTNPEIPGEITVDIHGKLLKTYFELESVLGSQIETYDNWVTNLLKKQLASRKFKIPRGEVVAMNPVFFPPRISTSDNSWVPLTPRMARDNAYTYSSELYVDLVLNAGTPQEEKIPTFLGRIPVMLGSVLCHLRGKTDREKIEMAECANDPLGYFIIKGAEKVILIQEKLRVNRIFIFNSTSKGDVVCKMTCNTITGSSNVTIVKGKKSNALEIHLAFMGRSDSQAGKVGNTVTVFQIYRMLGVRDPTQILQMIFLFTKREYHKKIWVQLQPTFVEFAHVADDIEYISKKKGLGDLDYSIRQSNIMNSLTNELFTHIPPGNITHKLYMLSIMVARFTEYLIGVRKLDDRDNWGNKRLESAGRSLEQLFGNIWREILTRAQDSIDTKGLQGLQAVKREIDPSFITDNFVSSFTANNWGVQGSYMAKENITDALKRDSNLSVYSHLTKINTPTNRKAKQVKVRLVQMSQLGFICAVESPEGQQCVTLDTPILLANNYWSCIENVNENNKVVTVNKDMNKEISGITNKFTYHTSSNGKKLYRLRTINGREIRATEDHPFLTLNGWKTVKELTLSDQVCVYPIMGPVSNDVEDTVILTEAQFVQNIANIVKDSLIKTHLNVLKEKGLFPLKSTSSLVPILARMGGYTLADGTLAIYNKTPILAECFGQEDDGVEFENDVAAIGFDRVKISYRETTVTDKNTGRITIHHTYRVQHSSALASLMIALGFSFGKKTNVYRKSVPSWILNGSDLTKREFISGFQGGDGTAIQSLKRKGKPRAYNISIGKTIQHICHEYKNSLFEFMMSISTMIMNLGVDVNRVQLNEDKNSDNIISSYSISGANRNIIKYMDIIGYRYCKTKLIKGMTASEYLKYKMLKIDEKNIVKSKAISMYKNKKTIRQIATELNIRYRIAGSIIEYWREKGDVTSTLAPKDTLTYGEFYEKTIIRNDCIYIQLSSKELVDADFVSDFTTVSENHNFIANGFVTHNCGLVKNAALTLYISIERSENVILEYISKYISKIPTEQLSNPLVLNGKFLGWCAGESLRGFCVALRRQSVFYKDTAIVLTKDGFLYIYTDAARPTRPLLIVDQTNGELVIKNKNLWNANMKTMLDEGCVEYIDAFEQEYIMLAQDMADIDSRRAELEEAVRNHQESVERLAALEAEMADAQTDVVTYQTQELENTITDARESVSQAADILNDIQSLPPYTHSELDPSAILGIAASLIPLANHNQAPRNTYQCLYVKNCVLKSSNERKQIGDLINGDTVVTIDPETMKMSETKIHSHFVVDSRKSDKKVLEITTHSNRVIQATHDHGFLTLHGWIEAGKLDPNKHHLSVYPSVKYLDDTRTSNDIIIDIDISRMHLISIGLKDTLVEPHLDHIEKLGLLPLKCDHPHLPIIARIMGFMRADGHINLTETGGNNIRTRMTFGREYDAELFNRDVVTLGFTPNKIQERHDTYYYEDGSEITHHVWAIDKWGSFASFFAVMDCVLGKKTESLSNPIPDWIMNGTDLIKREYVSGFMGGDGCKINVSSRQYKSKRGATYDMGRVVQHKHKDYLNSSLDWFNQFITLLEGFGIVTSNLKYVPAYGDKYRVELEFSSTRDNLIRYMDTIGYRYATTKLSDSLKVTEWLKYVKHTIDTVTIFRKTIHDMHYDGKYTHPQLSKKFGITVARSQHLCKQFRKGTKVNLPNGSIRLEEWMECVSAKNNCIFVPIRSIKEIEGCMVSDFTTVSENHSFIAGDGFITHNCSMGGQALGIYHSQHATRFETTAKCLAYPTRPLFETQMNKVLGMNELPAGSMVIVAIMTYTGYNQEDAIIMNKASIDRGLFRQVLYKSYKNIQKRTRYTIDEFTRPEIRRGEAEERYAAIDENGIALLGSFVREGDCIIGKIRRNIETGRVENASTYVGVGLEGIVDKILVSTNPEGMRVVKVKIRQIRKPMMGDKYASRHAQKATIGLILDEEDMPYTAEGIKPDILINPHCIPSRMTIAKMIEIVTSKIAAFSGERVNATAFRRFNIREFKENLRQYGYSPSGKEKMYSGFTGKPLEAQIFIGPCYYQVLRHHVLDKVQMRARGAIKQLSHQPVGGRARKGGQRFGEMERDAIISHGASAFLQERLCGVSDAYQAVYCSTCGTIAIANHASDKFVCRSCGDNAKFGTCTIPYAYKLLTHILAGAGFNLQFGMNEVKGVTPEANQIGYNQGSPLGSPIGLGQLGSALGSLGGLGQIGTDGPTLAPLPQVLGQIGTDGPTLEPLPQVLGGLGTLDPETLDDRVPTMVPLPEINTLDTLVVPTGPTMVGLPDLNM